MLWEDEFYENGASIAARIKSLVPHVRPTELVRLATEARTAFKLRHAPLWLAACMDACPTTRAWVLDLGADRIIVFTDEQSHDRVDPNIPCPGYMVNVASYQQGVAYAPPWTHINGFSEATLNYIRAREAPPAKPNVTGPGSRPPA